MAKTMLEIIVAARKPLSLQQLGDCFAIRNYDRKYHGLRRQPDIARTVDQLFKNFIRVIDNHCYLVHQSAKDYLLNVVTQGTETSWFHTTAVQASATMTERYLWFLNLDDFSEITLLSRDSSVADVGDEVSIVNWPDRQASALGALFAEIAFLDYAVHYWTDHIREVESLARPNTPLEFDVYKTFLHNKPIRAHWFMKLLRLTDIAVSSSVHRIPPASFCAYNGHTSLLKMVLLACEANINDQMTETGYHALHFTIAGKRPEMVAWLLKNGVNVEVTDTFGRTPLHLAARRNDIGILRLLLAHGANIYAQDYDGRIPLDGAE